MHSGKMLDEMRCEAIQEEGGIFLLPVFATKSAKRTVNSWAKSPKPADFQTLRRKKHASKNAIRYLLFITEPKIIHRKHSGQIKEHGEEK